MAHPGRNGQVGPFFMPFQGLHACRLKDPGQFKPGSFRNVARRARGKPLQVIIGRLKSNNEPEAQSLRYPTSSWETQQARDH